MIICGRFYLNTMHANRANLIMRYFSIQWSDSKTGNTVATVRISRLFLWYVMNELMHVMQRQNDACDARIKWCMWCKNDFFLVHGWSLQSSSLIKSWVQNLSVYNYIWQDRACLVDAITFTLEVLYIGKFGLKFFIKTSI